MNDPEFDGCFTYQELRSLAEYASTFRGEEVSLIRREGAWTVVASPSELRAGERAITVKNAALPPRPVVVGGWLVASSGGELLMADLMHLEHPKGSGRMAAADAVFWTESAVEKFLVPYYASVAGNRAPEVVREILNVLDFPREGSAADSEEGDAFALAHIPRSEYVTVAGGLTVLAHGPGGRVETRTLEEHAAYVQRRKSAAKAGSRDT